MKTWKANKDELLNDEGWQRVTRKVGNFTYLYFFYILEKDNQTFILNTQTLMCTSLDGVGHKIFPLVYDLYRDAFIMKSKTIYKTYMEYICIDNVIIDSSFNQTIIDISYLYNPVVIDSLEKYIAVQDIQGIHIFMWNPSSKDEPLINVHYCYKDIKSKPYGGLFIDFNDDHYRVFSIVEYFDPKDKKFVVNVKKLLKEDAESKESWIHNYGCGEHYGLMDGLDGDSDAYWNID